MSRGLFRGAVAASAILYMIWYFLPYDSFHKDFATVNLLRLDGHGALINPQNSFLAYGLLLLWLVAYLGLWHFDSWARHLYLGLVAASLVMAGLFGVRVSSPAEVMFGLLVDLFDGAILALAYFSSAKEFFASKRRA